MVRALLVVASLVFSAVLQAQPEPEVIALAISPAAPKAGLPYRLMHDPRDLRPGNAATLYQRSLAMLFENAHLAKEMKDEQWGNWLKMPLADWPQPAVDGKLRMARWLVREVELAGEFRDCDWLTDRRPEGIGLLLPDMQGFRAVGSIIAVQARHQIHSGDLDGAIKSIRTGLTLARNLGRGPTLIQALVGAAIAQMMFQQLDALIRSPNAPNLYWDLTALPRPFIDLSLALRDEVDVFERMMPALHHLDARALTEEELQAIQVRFEKMYDEFGMRKANAEEQALRAAMIADAEDAARKNLIARGLRKAIVDKMPAYQAVALDLQRQYRDVHAELFRWFSIPHFSRHPGYDEVAKRHDAVFLKFDFLYFRGLLKALSNGGYGSSVVKVFDAVERVDRRIALFRNIEAIRGHASANKGQFPATLSGVTLMPVPHDPVHGTPFRFESKDGKVTLAAPPWAGEKPTRANSITYELTIRN